MSDTSPRDQSKLFHGAGQAPPKPRPPRELLFEFMRGHDRMMCELVDHGPELGVEAQFWRNEEFYYSRRFDPRLDRSRPSREMAIAWAQEERKAIETGR